MSTSAEPGGRGGRELLPVSFDDVPYFNNQFRGDLIVTRGVIYYFPHVNVEAEKARRKVGPSDAIDYAAQFLGTVGEAIGLFGLGKAFYNRTANFRRKLRRPTVNRTRLRGLGLWPDGDSCEEAQRRLDAYVEAERRRPAQLTEYEFSLPRPLRFTAAEVKAVRLRFGSLRFETEFDSHDFTVGFRLQGLLREALREGGFF